MQTIIKSAMYRVRPFRQDQGHKSLSLSSSSTMKTNAHYSHGHGPVVSDYPVIFINYTSSHLWWTVSLSFFKTAYILLYNSVHFHITSVLQCVLCTYKLLFLLNSQTANMYHSVTFCVFFAFCVSKLRLLSYFIPLICVMYYSVFYSTVKLIMLHIRLLCANKKFLLTYLSRLSRWTVTCGNSLYMSTRHL